MNVPLSRGSFINSLIINIYFHDFKGGGKCFPKNRENTALFNMFQTVVLSGQGENILTSVLPQGQPNQGSE